MRVLVEDPRTDGGDLFEISLDDGLTPSTVSAMGRCGVDLLGLDPALVEELTVMAAGPYDVGGKDDAGTGTEAAVDFLERLEQGAAEAPEAHGH